MSNIQINHYFFSNSGITDRDIWHCSHNIWQGLCNGTVSVHPSVCLSVPAINCCSSMRRVCCCGSGGQEISIDCGTAGAQLQWRCTMAVWQSAAEAEHWVDTSPTLLYREITGCPPVSCVIQERQLRFFGHVARADPKQDHHRVIGASLRPPSHWRRPFRCPRTSWMGAIDTDVQSVNIGIHSAWWKASDYTLWRCIVYTVTLHHGACSHWRRRK